MKYLKIFLFILTIVLSATISLRFQESGMTESDSINAAGFYVYFVYSLILTYHL